MFLIDGYNLLHATDLFGVGELEGTLRGSREALVEFLVDRLTAKERRATTVVFDSSQAPPGLPDLYDERGLTVRFSRGYPDADTLLEEMIDAAPDRRNLTVVSGDRRVQRAARGRGAKPIDSGPWFAEMSRRESSPEADRVTKPTGPVEDADHWVGEFSSPALDEEIRRQEQELKKPPRPRASAAPQEKRSKNRRRKPSSKPKQEFGEGIFDPFPPGYAEDLLRDENDPPE
ncbi:YacP-like NYN domain protein [Pseudobythopirellula maris]|uniref:YacP-like NYN domain protein n=1 Tax=Pseudobythopirellula maris TaxID=2527991 RepID=A0A5C5ZHE5_9BACT|nr:NYN domain-containing protein [Pseudobythopirellula maris]TWT86477.1 YacP-like NYN domain protein [Pseudobythopirellula maris]